MKIVIRAVGKLRDRHMDEVCHEYLKRAGRHLPVTVEEVDDGDDLLDDLPTGCETVALDPNGAGWTTAAFITFLAERMRRGSRAVCFAIGGAEGLPAAIVKRAQHRLSLTPLTLPHRLARVVLCEQIYRCLSAIRGEPYNR